MKPVILVLDDQPQYLRSLERALRGQYEMRSMSRLQDAIDAISDEIDLILTDIRLDESIADDRQGLELVRYARAKYPEMPVVAMSALQETDVAQQALAAGATRFLSKPIVISNLKTLLDELMQGTR